MNNTLTPMEEWWDGRLKAGTQLHQSTLDTLYGLDYDFKGEHQWKEWVATAALMYDYMQWCANRATVEADKQRKMDFERAAERTKAMSFSMAFRKVDRHARRERKRSYLQGESGHVMKFRYGFSFDILPAHIEIANVRDTGYAFPHLQDQMTA